MTYSRVFLVIGLYLFATSLQSGEVRRVVANDRSKMSFREDFKSQSLTLVGQLRNTRDAESRRLIIHDLKTLHEKFTKSGKQSVMKVKRDFSFSRWKQRPQREATSVSSRGEEDIPTFRIPFGSKNYPVQLIIVDLTLSSAANSEVRNINKPEWIRISPITQQLRKTGQSDYVAMFTLSVEKNAPINTYQILTFLATSGREVRRKSIRVIVSQPERFELFQNFPNPFNPTTVVSYTLPERQRVTVKVYDILGKEVATLVNETSEAGYYEVVFDASAYSSGTYFYRMEAGNFVSVKKLMVLK